MKKTILILENWPNWRTYVTRAAAASMPVIALAMLVAVSSCKKDQPAPPTLPEVTTASVTVSGSTATGGGELIDDGNSPITAIGLAWSSTNTMPTVADDTTKNTISGVTFTATVDGLTPSTTYYFRAYATNAVGTAYGAVVTVNSGNGGPEARNTGIEGQANITNKIKATFTYFDHEGDAQAPGSYQWYVANDSTSGPGTAISGATDSTYTIPAADQGKFLRAAITPKASAGTTDGAQAFTPWIGPVGGEPTTVTFMYNGEEVTYGIITSATTGKKWLDRNIGAKQAATSPTDHLAYGDLFQWGRPADGHQLINWTSATTGDPLSGTTETKYTTATPNETLFVIAKQGTSWGDWITPAGSHRRWASNPQGPCPVGWHVPSKEDWEVEGSRAIDALNLTYTGERAGPFGLQDTGTFNTYYWSSTEILDPDGSYNYGVYFCIFKTYTQSIGAEKGRAVRCVHD